MRTQGVIEAYQQEMSIERDAQCKENSNSCTHGSLPGGFGWLFIIGILFLCLLKLRHRGVPAHVPSKIEKKRKQAGFLR